MNGYVESAIEIRRTAEFERWYHKQTLKMQIVVDARLQRIAIDGHFGTVNRFDDLIELKWKSGIRIYTHLMQSENVILVILLGGNKNGQGKDIRQAKKILGRILEVP